MIVKLSENSELVIKDVIGEDIDTVYTMKLYKEVETLQKVEFIITLIDRNAPYMMTEVDPPREIDVDHLPKIEVIDLDG